VLSLLDFSRDAPSSLLMPNDVPKVFCEMPFAMRLCPHLDRTTCGDSSEILYYGPDLRYYARDYEQIRARLTAPQNMYYKSADVVCTRPQGGSARYYPKGAEKFGFTVPSPEVSRLLATKGSYLTYSGARSWADGLFPINDYVEFVSGNADTYPALAARLKLDKFREMLSGPVAAAVFDTTRSHMEFERGCKVRIEDASGDFTIHKMYKESHQYGGVTVSVRRDTDGRTVSAASCALTHICPGAQDKGGEA
jgi:hypothetical protein